jgi:hypothetical protein
MQEKSQSSHSFSSFSKIKANNYILDYTPPLSFRKVQENRPRSEREIEGTVFSIITKLV